MNWSEFLTIVIKIFVIPLAGVLTSALVAYIKVKSQELIAKTDNTTAQKYITMAQETVSACVIATNQTYVETLKQQGKFDKEAQIEAFNRTKEAVLQILSTDAQAYLIEAVGDIDVYLNALIEAQVNFNKSSVVQVHTEKVVTE